MADTTSSTADRRPGPITEAACCLASQFSNPLTSPRPLRRGHRKSTPPGRRWRMKRSAHRSDLRRRARLNGLVADKRLELRWAHVCPLVTDLENWMRSERAKFSSQRYRQGDGLHAEALERLHALPRRWANLSHEQRGRAGTALCRPRPPQQDLLRLRSRRRAGSGDLLAHRLRCQAQRHRSRSLRLRRRASPYQRSSRIEARRTLAVALAATRRRRSRCLNINYPRPSPDAYASALVTAKTNHSWRRLPASPLNQPITSTARN